LYTYSRISPPWGEPKPGPLARDLYSRGENIVMKIKSSIGWALNIVVVIIYAILGSIVYPMSFNLFVILFLALVTSAILVFIVFRKKLR
jgi:hypothetical protein